MALFLLHLPPEAAVTVIPFSTLKARLHITTAPRLPDTFISDYNTAQECPLLPPPKKPCLVSKIFKKCDLSVLLEFPNPPVTGARSAARKNGSTPLEIPTSVSTIKTNRILSTGMKRLTGCWTLAFNFPCSESTATI